MVISWNGYTLWCLVFFCSFVNRLVQFYPEIFEGGGASTQHQVNFGKKWGAYSSIYELAEGNIIKFGEILTMPLEQCLLYLCYKADKSLLEGILHKEALKKNQ